jgi:hypothetical protein
MFGLHWCKGKCEELEARIKQLELFQADALRGIQESVSEVQKHSVNQMNTLIESTGNRQNNAVTEQEKRIEEIQKRFEARMKESESVRK